MSVIRVGSNKQYAQGWEAAFSGAGGKKKSAKASVSKGPAKKKSAKKKAAKKR